ncbi:unnamed protein product [Caenorhabditis bovis]|uniref:Uncharacterized protein n=1 Tax=Caenorhabditis bovis TaxID=2654633 RepID=A0A8S1EIG4_9PELO|nr:unnamed protein product [Caenorhabditis bovis]
MNNIIAYGGITTIPLYNCSRFSPAEWSLRDGMKRPILGSISMIYGIVTIVIYFPVKLALIDKDYCHISCFKIMAFLAIIDDLSLVVNSIITGYLSIEGAVFCTHPVLIYIAGMFGLGLWGCCCITVLILVLNRIIDLTNSYLIVLLFKGYRTFVWLIIPITYGCYFIAFTKPIAFSSKYFTWFFNPMIMEGSDTDYINFAHTANNLFVVAITNVTYIVFCFVVNTKMNEMSRQSRSKLLSRQIYTQSTLICLVNQVASAIYVVMNYMELPQWVTTLGHILWQISHGCPVFIYLTMNMTIRKTALKKIGVSRLHSIFSSYEETIYTFSSFR